MACILLTDQGGMWLKRPSGSNTIEINTVIVLL